jgi:hypothetical protein
VSDAKMLKPALIGGVIIGILSAMPLINYFNCFCCAWIIAGGMFAARLYVKESPAIVTLGRGVALGLLTGVIGAIVFALFSIPLYLMAAASGTGIMEEFKQALSQMPNGSPEALKAIDALSKQPNIEIILGTLGFIIWLLINCLAAMAGGAIGVALFEKRTAAPPNVPQYQPPSDLPPPPDGA